MMLLHGGRDDDIFIYQLFVFIFAKSGKGNELIAFASSFGSTCRMASLENRGYHAVG